MKIRRAILILVPVFAVLGIAPGRSPAGEPVPPMAVFTTAADVVVADPVPPPDEPEPLPPPSFEVLDLRSDLEGLIRSATVRNSVHGVLVVSIDRGDTLFSHNADVPLAPASNMKLFSTSAALYYLGPDFRYSTYALADGPIVDGVLDGDLILYGTGDPAISSRMLTGALTPLNALADSLRARGITEVRGDILGDGSYFDDSWIAEGWREEYRLDSYSAPIGALSLAENVVRVRVTPGGAAGAPASIGTTPSTHGLLIQNRVTTTTGGRSSVRFSWDPDGLVIEGQLVRGHPGVTRTVTVVDPANFAAAAFRTVLENAGIEINGDVRTVRRSEGSPVSFGAVSTNGGGSVPPRVVGTHLSPTLRELTSVANHVSQNLFAEAFFKTVGRVVLGDGSFQGGALAVQYFLECEKPFDFSAMRLVDGSGLSPINRVTPRATVHLLDLMTRTDVWEPFYESLPEAASPLGGQHSLRGRMRGTAAAGNLRAKTGTINNVSGLSGYVRSADGELLAFSILANEVPSTSRAKRTEDQIGARLAQFSRPPGDVVAAGTLTGVGAEADATGLSDVISGNDAGIPGTPGGNSSSSSSQPALLTPEPTVVPRTHQIRAGQTLEAIANQYGTTVAELRRLNPGVEPRRIQIGQTITLPSR